MACKVSTSDYATLNMAPLSIILTVAYMHLLNGFMARNLELPFNLQKHSENMVNARLDPASIV